MLISILQMIIAPLFVGIVLKLFDRWLDNRNNKH